MTLTAMTVSGPTGTFKIAIHGFQEGKYMYLIWFQYAKGLQRRLLNL